MIEVQVVLYYERRRPDKITSGERTLKRGVDFTEITNHVKDLSIGTNDPNLAALCRELDRPRLMPTKTRQRGLIKCSIDLIINPGDKLGACTWPNDKFWHLATILVYLPEKGWVFPSRPERLKPINPLSAAVMSWITVVANTVIDSV